MRRPVVRGDESAHSVDGAPRFQGVPRQVPGARGRKSGAGLSRRRGTGCTQGSARQSSGRNRTLARNGKRIGLNKGPNHHVGQNELAKGPHYGPSTCSATSREPKRDITHDDDATGYPAARALRTSRLPKPLPLSTTCTGTNRCHQSGQTTGYDLIKLRPFGSACYYLSEEHERFASRGRLGVVFGYSRLQSYYVLDFEHYVDTTGEAPLSAGVVSPPPYEAESVSATRMKKSLGRRESSVKFQPGRAEGEVGRLGSADLCMQ